MEVPGRLNLANRAHRAPADALSRASDDADARATLEGSFICGEPAFYARDARRGALAGCSHEFVDASGFDLRGAAAAQFSRDASTTRSGQRRRSAYAPRSPLPVRRSSRCQAARVKTP